MLVGNHRMLWITREEARKVLALVKADVKARRSRDCLELVTHLKMVIAAFDDDAERLKELEVVCRANSFWVNTPAAQEIQRIRAHKNHHKADKNLAAPSAAKVRKELEKRGRVKKLRGGLGT